jgi:gluconate 2-dehydrogenase gamma chain
MVRDPLPAALLATLTAVVDRLIPDDENGPGAVQLGVVGYVERTLEGEHARHRRAYEEWLLRLDECAAAEHGVHFVELDVARQDELLRRIEAGTSAAGELQQFFECVRTHVVEGMFGDPSWGGNRDGVGWDLIGYIGPKKVWSYEAQQLDVVANDDRRLASGGPG